MATRNKKGRFKTTKKQRKTCFYISSKMSGVLLT